MYSTMARYILYTFHYSDNGGTYDLTCVGLAQMLSVRIRDTNRGRSTSEADPNSDNARAPALTLTRATYDVPGLADARRDAHVGNLGHPPEQASCQPDGNLDSLHDVGLWVSAARLQWAHKSDRLLRTRDLNTMLADIQSDGDLEKLRIAFQTLSAALIAAYPPLSVEDRSTILQLIALGKDMAIAAAQSPDLFAYVKNELQPINLAALLKI